MEQKLEINKEIVRKHFNRHAHEYDRYASIQRTMCDKLAQMASDALEALPASGRPYRVLEIGCGTGRLTAALTGRLPEVRYTALDIADAMLDQTRLRLGARADCVSFIAADAEEWVGRPDFPRGGGNAAFDLIVSNAAFQWFNATGATIGKLLDALAPGGILAFATFGPQTFCELRAAFRAAEAALGLPHAPHGQSFLGGQDWTALFAGRQGTWSWQGELSVEHFTDVRSFLHSVQRIGAGNAVEPAEGAGVPQGAHRRLLSSMQACYRELFGSEEGIQATYELGYGLWIQANR